MTITFIIINYKTTPPIIVSDFKEGIYISWWSCSQNKDIINHSSYSMLKSKEIFNLAFTVPSYATFHHIRNKTVLSNESCW